MCRPLLAVLWALSVILGLAGSSTAGAAQSRPTAKVNTWTARSSTGRVLGGTWTVVPGDDGHTATGAWTLDDAQRRTVARGTWSASKGTTGWSGAWRASASTSTASYAGTWSAPLTDDRTAPFARLFERAAQAVVSGSWQAAALTGQWSIRVFN